MLITRRIHETLWEAESFGTGIVCQAATLDEAMQELQATLMVQDFAAARLRAIRRHSNVKYDPQLRCYVATMPAAGIEARGDTRNDAWERLLSGLRLADQARAAAAAREADAELAAGLPDASPHEEPEVTDASEDS